MSYITQPWQPLKYQNWQLACSLFIQDLRSVELDPRHLVQDVVAHPRVVVQGRVGHHDVVDPVEVVPHPRVDGGLAVEAALGTVAEQTHQLPALVPDDERAAAVAGADAAGPGRVPRGVGAQFSPGLLLAAAVGRGGGNHLRIR